MEGIIQAIEVFAFITGLAYIILEIGQKNLMWIVGIATGAACAFSFAVQHLWASMALNVYYVFISIWGLIQWRKAGEKLAGTEAALEASTSPTPTGKRFFSACSCSWLAQPSLSPSWIS